MRRLLLASPVVNPVMEVGQVTDDIVPVKRLIAARQEYQTALEELRLFYQRQGDLEFWRWQHRDDLKRGSCTGTERSNKYIGVQHDSHFHELRTFLQSQLKL